MNRASELISRGLTLVSSESQKQKYVVWKNISRKTTENVPNLVKDINLQK